MDYKAEAHKNAPILHVWKIVGMHLYWWVIVDIFLKFLTFYGDIEFIILSRNTLIPLHMTSKIIAFKKSKQNICKKYKDYWTVSII